MEGRSLATCSCQVNSSHFRGFSKGSDPVKNALFTGFDILYAVKNTVKVHRFLRWLDWIFLGGYLPSLSLNYVGMSKDMEKRLPQLYYIKMKISYDLGFIAIGVSMAM